MKELVCVAPSGDLEVWINLGFDLTFKCYQWHVCSQVGLYKISNSFNLGPESIGREVLGEL